MKNVGVAIVSLFLVFACASSSTGERPAHDSQRTEWEIRSAPGLDALLILGVVSGDELQQSAYAEELAELKALFSDETLLAIGELGKQVREMGFLLGPALVLVGSGGDDSSLDATIASFERPSLLRDSLERTPYWSEESWTAFEAAIPTVLQALHDLKASGYDEWYADQVLPDVAKGIAALTEASKGVDVIAEQERLLGRSLDPKMEVLLVEYSKPYGIKIQGQRFLNWWGYETTNPLRTAAHEIFHPPIDFQDVRVMAAVRRLESDPLLRSILEGHDPKYGYNSLQGIIDEDSAQALDQVVSERLGIGRPPGERWRKSDGGMHLLAAAIYDEMKESGFAREGGRFQSWLIDALNSGRLTGRELERRAAKVVGKPAVQVWLEQPTEESR